MDFYAMEGGGYVASGAQDGKIRIWKIKAITAAQATGGDRQAIVCYHTGGYSWMVEMRAERRGGMCGLALG
jgi:hypothetical protein